MPCEFFGTKSRSALKNNTLQLMSFFFILHSIINMIYSLHFKQSNFFDRCFFIVKNMIISPRLIYLLNSYILLIVVYLFKAILECIQSTMKYNTFKPQSRVNHVNIMTHFLIRSECFINQKVLILFRRNRRLFKQSLSKWWNLRGSVGQIRMPL